MSQKKARSIRKYVDKHFPPGKERIKAEKLMKNFRKDVQIRDLIPKKIKPLSKKMHLGESRGDFKDRRKVCNKRRRQRELLCRS
jgi:hypothetical protein